MFHTFYHIKFNFNSFERGPAFLHEKCFVAFCQFNLILISDFFIKISIKIQVLTVPFAIRVKSRKLRFFRYRTVSIFEAPLHDLAIGPPNGSRTSLTINIIEVLAEVS